MANGRLSDRKTLFIIFIFAFAAVVRFVSAHQFTLEWDEAQIVAIAKLPTIAEIIRIVSIRELHPPLLEILLHGWMQLFGEGDAAVHNFTWLVGMLGLWASYLLAKEMSGCRKTALAVMALTVLSPFILHYSSITTFYCVHYTLTVFSWYFFLRLLNPLLLPKNIVATAIFYALTTWAASYLHATAFLFVVCQAIYLAIQFRTGLGKPRFTIAGTIIALTPILLLPYFWLISQPWHLSKTYHLNYQLAPFWSFLFAPINLLFLGYDVRDFHEFPGIAGSLLCAVLGFYFLYQGGKNLWQQNRQAFWAVICIGVLPILLTYGMSLAGNLGIFQFRTFLYAIVALHFIVAVAILKHGNKWIAGFLIAAFILFQWGNPWKRPYWPDTGNVLARNVEAGFQSGDGIVFYPGWMSLVFLRYFDPENFGLSEHEQHFDPVKENYYNMVQRIDRRYFMVSGEQIWSRPDVQKAYREFERQHKRIWLITEPSQKLMSLLSCKNDYMVLTSSGQFTPQRCYLR